MLSDFVQEKSTELGIPGVAVGVWADGKESYACHGVTSLDNPLPVNPDTLYELGSATKTFTATGRAGPGRARRPSAPLHSGTPAQG
jgi:CubicO group peptidase (beta-lactamase class C family)